MGKINHGKINSKEDVAKKLKRYRRINKQISKELADKRLERAKCKKAVNNSNKQIMKLQAECRMWKTKFSELRQRVVDQIQPKTNDIQMNAVMSDDDIVETKNSKRLIHKPIKVTRNPGDLRYILKFVRKKRRRKIQFENIETIDEEEEESSHEVVAERKDGKDGSGGSSKANQLLHSQRE